MDPEITYIRSNDMEEQESISTNEDQTPWGGWEWLKTILFLAILFVAGFVTIRVAAPMLFTDYVPGIIGLQNQEADLQVENGEMDSPDTADSATGDTDEAADSPRDEAETENADTSQAGQEDAAEETTVIESGEEGKAEEEGKTDAEAGDSGIITPPEIEVYIVKVGDTLTSISATFGVTIEEIVAVNQFLNPNYVQVGQEINIPK